MNLCRALVSWFLVLLFAGYSAVHAQAQQSLYAVAATEAGNYEQGVVEEKYLDFGYGNLTNTFTFSGLDGSGQPATMTYADNAEVTASYGSLGASFSSTLTNVIYNVNNLKWYDNAAGVPDEFDSQSYASFTDTLTVQGGPGLASIKLLVRLHGTLSAVPYGPYGGSGYVALWYQLPGGGTTTFLQIAATAAAASIDELVMTPAFPVNAQGMATVGVGLQTFVEWELYSRQIPDHQTVTATIDFFDTLGVTQVQGFDASNQPVAVTSAMGSSGTHYAVPGPALSIQSSGPAVILSWSNPAFALQAAPAASGSYTNIPGATSPYTNTLAGPQQFFRLIGSP